MKKKIILALLLLLIARILYVCAHPLDEQKSHIIAKEYYGTVLRTDEDGLTIFDWGPHYKIPFCYGDYTLYVEPGIKIGTDVNIVSEHEEYGDPPYPIFQIFITHRRDELKKNYHGTVLRMDEDGFTIVDWRTQREISFYYDDYTLYVEPGIKVGTEVDIVSEHDDHNGPPYSLSQMFIAHDIRLDETFNEDGSRSWTDYFDVPGTERHYRVWVNNTGKTSITVRITSDSYTGAKQSEFTVAAGSQDYRDLCLSNIGGGRRYISIIGTSGNAFSGRVRVRTAASTSEF
ncbi:hypothetical protein [Pseudoflavonifractor sp. MSJ-37]|uniref:hypothetical protein n=1 Tax=Pseudoflavonifractor sp. MSJ-37 TaxID=2841531 RepID=UPI001C119A47|nr:hypothetical protein [Pseudoflavonifractor sp. MSJ-37]MBU5436123.1 hypothetical protein [Pseudoflavonifractor sp. MSJ-37]